MSNARIHARNLGMNWLGHGVNLVVMFFLSPFIVHSLGQIEFGLWSLLTVVTGYMGVLDLGIRSSTGRFIMLYLGKDDHRAVDETIRTALGFYCVLGLVAVAAGAGLGWLFPAVFRSVPEEYHLVAQLLLPILAINVWLSALQGIFSSLLAAHERFDLTRGVDLGVLAIRAITTVLALCWGYRIAALAIVAVASQVLATAGNYLLARRVYPTLRLWPLLPEKTRLRELFGYGLAAFISTISVRIIGQTDLLIAGVAIGVSAVTVYSVGAMLVYYSDSFLMHIRATMFPSIQRAVARNETGATVWLFRRASHVGLVFGLLPYIGIIAFAESFIRLWMFGPSFGEDSVQQAALVMQILAASKLALLFVGASSTVLNAMGHVRFTATLALAEAAVNLLLSLLFVLVCHWGLLGIASGTLVARLLVGTFIAPWFACAKTGANWRKYLITMGLQGMLAALVFLGICLLGRNVGSADSWLIFFAQVALVTAAYTPIAVCLLSPLDRQRIRRWFLRLLAAEAT